MRQIPVGLGKYGPFLEDCTRQPQVLTSFCDIVAQGPRFSRMVLGSTLQKTLFNFSIYTYWILENDWYLNLYSVIAKIVGDFKIPKGYG